jgi:UDP-arabinose 4-epimerase
MTNVLVTGGAGYIGSHTCQELSRAGMTPIVFDDLSTGFRESVLWGPLIEGTLADRESVLEALHSHDVSAVIHFAAKAYVGESMQHPRTYFQSNVVNTLNLLSAMLDCNVKTIVFSSTCAVYGHPRSIPITERSALHPVNPYGESKAFVERVLRRYEQAYSLNWFALRYFNAAGADADGALGERHALETHIIPLAIANALGNASDLHIFGTDYPTADGTAIRDYIHVSDLASAHIAALNHLFAGGRCEAINLGTGKGHSVRDVVAAVERVSGRGVTVREMPRRPGDPAILVADPSRANKVLAWSPGYTQLESIVATSWQWHKNLVQLEQGRTAASLKDSHQVGAV